uniref:Uncharacterized protein n=1 Tax=mine drainage metagenome TaxID=410659 RepID=E6QWH0_9ZZZZ
MYHMNPCLWGNAILARESLHFAATNEISGDDTQYHLAKFIYQTNATQPPPQIHGISWLTL